jgi:hypothetical protein
MWTELQSHQKPGFKTSPALVDSALATATKDLGKNLGKSGDEHTLKVWTLDHIKNDTIEMKEHTIGLASSPSPPHTLRVPPHSSVISPRVPPHSSDTPFSSLVAGEEVTN